MRVLLNCSNICCSLVNYLKKPKGYCFFAERKKLFVGDEPVFVGGEPVFVGDEPVFAAHEQKNIQRKKNYFIIFVRNGF